jgi:heme oxygenase
LYVLEGSLLGGRVIGRHLKEHFGENIVLPLNFYRCYGADLIVQWQGFSLFMGECFNYQNDEVINEVIDSANVTFSSLQQWVESGLIQHLPLN